MGLVKTRRLAAMQKMQRSKFGKGTVKLSPSARPVVKSGRLECRGKKASVLI